MDKAFLKLRLEIVWAMHNMGRPRVSAGEIVPIINASRKAEDPVIEVNKAAVINHINFLERGNVIKKADYGDLYLLTDMGKLLCESYNPEKTLAYNVLRNMGFSSPPYTSPLKSAAKVHYPGKDDAIVMDVIKAPSVAAELLSDYSEGDAIGGIVSKKQKKTSSKRRFHSNAKSATSGAHGHVLVEQCVLEIDAHPVQAETDSGPELNLNITPELSGQECHSMESFMSTNVVPIEFADPLHLTLTERKVIACLVSSSTYMNTTELCASIEDETEDSVSLSVQSLLNSFYISKEGSYFYVEDQQRVDLGIVCSDQSLTPQCPYLHLLGFSRPAQIAVRYLCRIENPNRRYISIKTLSDLLPASGDDSDMNARYVLSQKTVTHLWTIGFLALSANMYRFTKRASLLLGLSKPTPSVINDIHAYDELKRLLELIPISLSSDLLSVEPLESMAQDEPLFIQQELPAAKDVVPDSSSSQSENVMTHESGSGVAQLDGASSVEVGLLNAISWLEKIAENPPFVVQFVQNKAKMLRLLARAFAHDQADTSAKFERVASTLEIHQATTLEERIKLAATTVDHETIDSDIVFIEWALMAFGPSAVDVHSSLLEIKNDLISIKG